jgi:hypothetical protein
MLLFLAYTLPTRSCRVVKGILFIRCGNAHVSPILLTWLSKIAHVGLVCSQAA